MKLLLIIPVVFLAACASRPAKKITIIHASAELKQSALPPLRTPEQIREYRLGRYADPRDTSVMHEGHPLYRVESSARWNLNYAGSIGTQPAASPQSKVSTNDAVLAEVNKQRAATKAFIEQTTTLNQKLGELSQVAGQSQEIAKQNLELKRDVVVLRERLDAVESQARDRKAASPAAPKPSAEDKW